VSTDREANGKLRPLGISIGVGLSPEATVREQVRTCVRGVISPLLANLYMRRFVLGWKKLGLEQSLGTRIVTCPDDLVILCRKGNAEEVLARMRALMGKLKLTVNEEKTRICKVPEGEFDIAARCACASTDPAQRIGDFHYCPVK